MQGLAYLPPWPDFRLAGRQGVPVNENTPLEKNALSTISLQSTTSGAGEQFLLLAGMAKAARKGVLFFPRHWRSLYVGRTSSSMGLITAPHTAAA